MMFDDVFVVVVFVVVFVSFVLFEEEGYYGLMKGLVWWMGK